MFKSLASDAFGLSDIGKIIPQSQFHQTDVDDYVFHEDNEKIYFVIKSKSDEYCFTNLAFIHLDGQSATSKKRLLKRYPYRYFAPSSVMIETAGTMDLDAELKFLLGSQPFSIDIDKKDIEQIKDIYKALTAIGDHCRAIEQQAQILDNSFKAVVSMIDLKSLPDNLVMNLPDIINQTMVQVESAYHTRLNQIKTYDFGAVFEHYLGQ